MNMNTPPFKNSRKPAHPLNIPNSRQPGHPKVKTLRTAALFALFCIIILASGCGTPNPTPKYVFFFIGDGMGLNQIHAAEMYAGVLDTNKVGSQKMSFSEFPVVGFMSDHSEVSFSPTRRQAAQPWPPDL